jgi:LPXTG-motif cell wall-anchored protein
MAAPGAGPNTQLDDEPIIFFHPLVAGPSAAVSAQPGDGTRTRLDDEPALWLQFSPTVAAAARGQSSENSAPAASLPNTVTTLPNTAAPESSMHPTVLALGALVSLAAWWHRRRNRIASLSSATTGSEG